MDSSERGLGWSVVVRDVSDPPSAIRRRCLDLLNLVAEAVDVFDQDLYD